VTQRHAAAAGPHRGESHTTGLSGRLNWLRAGVLGANDGLTSTAGVVGLWIVIPARSASVPLHEHGASHMALHEK
jgi:hypothetical protein